jgi:uncharacterized protein (TIGR03435 family)
MMLQKLLTERFQISLHTEVKETPVYRLNVARNGPKLKPPEELPHYQNEEERQAGMRKRAEENLAKMVAARQAGSGRQGVPLVWHARQWSDSPKRFPAIWTGRSRT